MVLYDRNIIGTSSEIFGYLRPSSVIFGKCSENVWRRLSSLRNNFGKSSESGRKSSESRQKHRYQYVYIINRIIHGCQEIWNLSSRVHNRYLEDKFHISARPCIILYFLQCVASPENMYGSQRFCMKVLLYLVEPLALTAHAHNIIFLTTFLLFLHAYMQTRQKRIVSKLSISNNVKKSTE